MTEIPPASSFTRPRKVGHLKKLTGKGWIYSGCWKRRFCVLDGTKLYFYEGETSQGNEKTAGVIGLDYYDLCEEGTSKDEKRVANVFTIGTSVRGFFDNRHLFSADSTEERDDWMKTIRNAIDDARSNRRRAGRSKLNGKKEKRLDSSSSDKENQLEQENIEVPLSDRLPNVTKDRAKGPTGRRLPQRKSMMPTTMKDEVNESERQRSASLSGLSGIIEDGESDNRKSQSMEVVIDGKMRNESICSSNKDDISSDQEITFGKQHLPVPSGHSPVLFRNTFGPDQSAFLRELESKVGASHRQSKRIMPNNEEDKNDEGIVTVKNSVEVVRSRMTLLGTQIEHVQKEVAEMRKDISKVQEEMAAKDAKISEQSLLMEKRMNVVLKEANTMFEKAQEVLQEAQQTKNECCSLKEEFQEILDTIKNNQMTPTSSMPNAIDTI